MIVQQKKASRFVNRNTLQYEVEGWLKDTSITPSQTMPTKLTKRQLSKSR